jgi:hypothetical protein
LKVIGFNILVSLFFCCTLCAQNSVSEWVLEKEEEEIRISYRWIRPASQSRVREMKAEFTVDAPVTTIVEQLQNSEKIRNWQTSIQKCEVTELEDQQWLTYLQFELPWPFRSKDLVTRNTLLKDGKNTIINSKSTPDAVPVKNKVNRILSMDSQWNFNPLQHDKTFVVYTTISYDEPEFPRFIADPIIQNRLVTTLGLLRKNSEDETNTK